MNPWDRRLTAAIRGRFYKERNDSGGSNNRP